MSTQRMYLDTCALCGRQLKGNVGSKLYWPAYRIREISPSFKGETIPDRTLGVPHEFGGYVCRNRVVCNVRLHGEGEVSNAKP